MTVPLSDAIQPQIAAALQILFTQRLVTIGSDRLSARTIQLWPLQLDPTQVAPYLVYSEHPQMGEIPNLRMAEVGGPTYHYTYWRTVFGTPRANTRDQGYSDIYTFRNRIQEALQSTYNLQGLIAPGALISAGGGEVLEGNNPMTMLLGSAVRIFGGQGTFYGEGKLVWRYLLRRNRNW